MVEFLIAQIFSQCNSTSFKNGGSQILLVSESPGGLIQAQIAVLHPKVSIQEVGVRPRSLGYNIFPGVQMLLVTLRTTALEDDHS